MFEKNVKHTRSAGGVVLNKNGNVLVVSQRGKSWSLPKGHIEEGEIAIDAAKREIEEETGITEMEFVKELGSYQRYRISPDGGEDTTEIKTIIMFLFRTGQDELKPKDEENPEAVWMNKEDVVKTLTHERDKQFFLESMDKF